MKVGVQLQVFFPSRATMTWNTIWCVKVVDYEA